MVGDQQAQVDVRVPLLGPAQGRRRQPVEVSVVFHHEARHPIGRDVPLDGLVQQGRQLVPGQVGTEEEAGANMTSLLIIVRFIEIIIRFKELKIKVLTKYSIHQK